MSVKDDLDALGKIVGYALAEGYVPEASRAASDAFSRIQRLLDATKQRLHAVELGFKGAASVKDTGTPGVQVATWLYDGEHDEFLCVFLPSGGLAWLPASKLEIDTSCLIDSRKVAEKVSGAFPGEITYQPKEEEDPDA